jgi:hypothetical protein
MVSGACRAWLDDCRFQLIQWPSPAVEQGSDPWGDLHFDATAKLSELMLRSLKKNAGLQGALCASRFPTPFAAGAPLHDACTSRCQLDSRRFCKLCAPHTLRIMLAATFQMCTARTCVV